MDTLSVLAGIGGGTVVASLTAWIALRAKEDRVKKLESEEQVFKQLFDTVEEAAGIMSEDGTFIYANKALKKLLAVPEKGGGRIKPGSLPKIEIKKESRPLDLFLREGIRYHEKGERIAAVPQCKLTPHGSRESISVTIYAKRLDNLPICRSCYAFVIRDLRRQETEHCLVHAHQLTNLPNEIQAKKDLNRIFSRIHLHDKKLALMLLEIDNFSQIRAMVGHEQAEKQLVHIARYLEKEAEAVGGFVYHMFTNVFMIVLPKVDRHEEIEALCEKIEKQLENFYEIDNIKLHLSASVGIAVYPDSGSTFMLLDNAFKALSEAQKSGFGQCKFYHEISSGNKFDELELYNSLHKAIDEGEFEVYYQPIVRASDLEVIGAEALIRWKHPKYGFVPPDLFVPMLEKSGYIVELGRYVLDTVLKQLKRWEMFKFKPVQVSINMSLMELESDGFVENVSHQLEAHQILPDFIKFEITEGIAMQNEAVMHERLERLRKLGISIALDDFGTGYTSFSYLKRIPADLVKIDRSMVQHILESKDDERIVHAMIELGHNLDMKVVVEGVEDEWMLKKLVELGCDYLQGYYFSKPLPAFEFQELIRFESKHITKKKSIFKE